MERSVTVRLGDLAREALASEASAEGNRIPATTVQAIRCYLNDKESAGSAWPYPAFMRKQGNGAGVELELHIDGDLWRSLEDEADRQGVSAQRLVEHAALYFAAEVDAGRITRRILDELDEEG